MTVTAAGLPDHHVGRPLTPILAIGDALAITRRNLLHIVRTPQLLAFSSIQPIMFVLLFRYVFGGAIDVPGEYVNYLMPGIFVQTTLFGGGSTAVGLAEDLKGGIIDRFRTLPMARSAVLAGRTLADLVRNVLVMTLMVVVGVLVGFRFGGTIFENGIALLTILAFGYAFSWIFAFVGLTVKDPETAQVAGFLPLFPLVFASSAFVAVESMPSWLHGFAEYQPVSVVINAVRAMVQGQPVGDWLWMSLAWVAGILTIFVPLAIRQYRRTES